MADIQHIATGVGIATFVTGGMIGHYRDTMRLRALSEYNHGYGIYPHIRTVSELVFPPTVEIAYEVFGVNDPYREVDWDKFESHIDRIVRSEDG